MIQKRSIITGTKKELISYFKDRFRASQPMSKMEVGSEYELAKRQIEGAYANNELGGHTFGIFFYIAVSHRKNELRSQYFYITDFKQTETTKKNDMIFFKSLEKNRL